MYKNVVILTDYDLYHTTKTMSDSFSIDDILISDFNVKREVFYKAERILYINKFGDTKVLKDRYTEFTREFKAIDARKKLRKPKYFIGPKNINYILTNSNNDG